MHRFIDEIKEKRQAIFVGFFGPIGVSAIFYLYISLEFLETITVDGVQRADAEGLGEVMMVVVWFLVICSIVSPILTYNVGTEPDIPRLYTGLVFPWENLASSCQEPYPEHSLPKPTKSLSPFKSLRVLDR
jgi:hypothetical protein